MVETTTATPDPDVRHGPSWTADRSRVGLVALSAGAGVIHLAVAGRHAQEAAIFGAFFVAAGMLQVALAVTVAVRPSRRAWFAGAVMSAGLVALWAVSRTVGLPVGPEAGSPERVGIVDAVAVLFEAAFAVGALAVARRDPARRSRLDADEAVAIAFGVAVITAAAILAGEPGHHATAALGHAALHHAFHLLFMGMASLAFTVYLAAEVRRNGWPRFSWRLRPEPAAGSTP